MMHSPHHLDYVLLAWLQIQTLVPRRLRRHVGYTGWYEVRFNVSAPIPVETRAN